MATRDTCETLKKVAPDEPIFVLRGQDRCAPGIVRMWADSARALGARNEKVDEALRCADAMEAWTPRHLPD